MSTPPSPDAEIAVYNETDLQLPMTEKSARAIIQLVENEETCNFQLVEVVYVDEATIREINQQHLDHDYVTDIITFRYDEDDTLQHLEGTLYCCAPRIIEQAGEYNSTETDEFNRILVHGLLHLIGYEDETEEQRQQMRNRENHYLQKIT